MCASKTCYVAIDLGASSGRHVVGQFDGNRLELEELHRFDNSPIAAAGRLYWNLLGQWQQVLAGLKAAQSRYGDRIASIGVDSWGVDFVLLDRLDELLSNPVCYRDARTDGMMNRAFSIVPRDQIFAQTGLQFLQINTLYQLLAMQAHDSSLLDCAETMLLMPDAFHWLLSGAKSVEMTNATTTQFFNPVEGRWASELLDRFSLPVRILGDIVPPGTKLGVLTESVASAIGMNRVAVVAPGTHDTASAVMAVPTKNQLGIRPNWCYISSGTWSLMGVEVQKPVINDKCLALNFTNEGGIGGTTRLLKNICGLWLVQECRRVWNEAGKSYTWDHLAAAAAASKPLVSLIDPDDAGFLGPTDMPAAIREFCRRTKQAIPADDGAVVRCVLESIAMQYRRVLGWLEELIGGRIETIHIVGGGANNRQLCQMASDACNRRVLAGPTEATAIGNLMMQAVAAGEVESIEAAREVIRRSFSVVEYQPVNAAIWDEHFSCYLQLASV
ncbi:MAG: rhamnulokinase [Pirellulales bacterium]|nr:rhamnulokinase [Pirellulales bacterium]